MPVLLFGGRETSGGWGGSMPKKPVPRPWRDAGDRLRRSRDRLDLKQPQMADRLGISTGYYGHIEQGQKRPSPEMLRDIVRVLNEDFNAMAVLYGYRAPEPGEERVVVSDGERAPFVKWMARLPAEQLAKLQDIATILFHPGLGAADDDDKAETEDDD